FNNGVTQDQILFDGFMDTDDSNGGPFTFGMRSSSYNTTSSFRGMIHEVITFNKNLSELEDQKIRTYLSMKYGLGMMNMAPWDYVSSDGTVIYETAGSYQGYESGVAAIGLDDGNHHFQRKSKGAGDALLIGIVEGAETTDGNFLAWGNNGEPFLFERTIAGIPNIGTNRVWRFQETGETGELRVVVGDAVNLGITHIALHPNDPQVTNPEQIICLQDLNGRMVAHLDIEDGYYMTLVSYPIAISETITSPSCGNSNGQIVTNVSNAWGTSAFSWSPASVDGALSNTASNLVEGSYEITVTDESGCRITQTYDLTDSGGITLLGENVTRVSCNGANDATAQVTLDSPHTPIDIVWDHGPTSASLTGLSGGTYSYTATDAEGCEYSDNVVIVEPEVLGLDNVVAINNACPLGSEGYILADIIGGSPSYDVKLYGTTMLLGEFVQSADIASLEDVDGSFSFSNLTSQTYQLVVTDNANCEYIYDFEITTNTALPVPTCPGNQSEFANGDCNFEVPDYFAGNEPGGACSVTYEQTPAAGTIVST
ncbi:MAG: hypothetical protein AAF193_06625, partial [Bacteroidota bacterium]